MTDRDFLTIHSGFRVSGGASIGFLARCADNAPGRLTKFLKTATERARASASPQSVGAARIGGGSGRGLHAPNIERGVSNDDRQGPAPHAG